MSMEQFGFVTSIEDGLAKIRVDRESACGGNCAGCHGCPQNAIIISWPDNPENPFMIGERVKVTMPTNNFFAGIFKSYGVLILALLAGAILGYEITGIDGGSVVGVFIGLVIGGFVVKLISDKSKNAISVTKEFK